MRPLEGKGPRCGDGGAGDGGAVEVCVTRAHTAECRVAGMSSVTL